MIKMKFIIEGLFIMASSHKLWRKSKAFLLM